VPNCDFYATPEDHQPLLEWMFAEGTCEVYESYSAHEQPLLRFGSANEVLRQFERRHANGKPWDAVHLQLYVPGTGPPFVARRIAVNPTACDGATFRYCAEGWGLVQLYLAAPRDGRLNDSHTNHNSRVRAEAWAGTAQDEQGPEAWDFRRITSFSSRLNRQIRKSAVAKIGSRVVLPGALRQWEAGLSLWPYRPGEHSVQLL
jgi:hypothetical protein